MSTNQPHSPCEIEIDIKESDIDELNHVNNIVYLQWVQDAAVAHWNILASEEEKTALSWVIARHEIDYKRPVFLGDKVVAATWLGGMNHRYFERLTEIKRVSDNKVCAAILTLWCPVDVKSMKPIKVTEELKARFSAVNIA